MQREIKFRGKDIKNNWHYGLLAHNKRKDKHYEWFISNSVGEAYAYGVIKETIGQFTGLTDKNGKEIYEGDVLLYHFERYGEFYQEVVKKGYIKCENGSFVFYVLKNDGVKRNDFDPEFYALSDLNYDPDSVEIIGNIHQNTELLK